eukprot:440726-Rhodomonas_salina.2
MAHLVRGCCEWNLSTRAWQLRGTRYTGATSGLAELNQLPTGAKILPDRNSYGLKTNLFSSVALRPTFLNCWAADPGTRGYRVPIPVDGYNCKSLNRPISARKASRKRCGLCVAVTGSCCFRDPELRSALGVF